MSKFDFSGQIFAKFNPDNDFQFDHDERRPVSHRRRHQ